MLDDIILQAFIHTFYGYGTYSAPYWFIGMEEGGGNSPDEISSRLSTWHANGRNELHSLDLSMTRFGGDYPRIQRTWGHSSGLCCSN